MIIIPVNTQIMMIYDRLWSPLRSTKIRINCKKCLNQKEFQVFTHKYVIYPASRKTTVIGTFELPLLAKNVSKQIRSSPKILNTQKCFWIWSIISVTFLSKQKKFVRVNEICTSALLLVAARRYLFTRMGLHQTRYTLLELMSRQVTTVNIFSGWPDIGQAIYD